MPYNSGDYTIRRDDFAPDTDFQLALVVGTSHINRIVVSRIAENAGLKALAVSPNDALNLLAERRPGFVIIDAGSDDCEFAPLLESLARRQLVTDRPSAFVVMLADTTAAPGGQSASSVIDAVVTRPITPEKLQPLIRRLLYRVQD